MSDVMSAWAIKNDLLSEGSEVPLAEVEDLNVVSGDATLATLLQTKIGTAVHGVCCHSEAVGGDGVMYQQVCVDCQGADEVRRIRGARIQGKFKGISIEIVPQIVMKSSERTAESV